VINLADPSHSQPFLLASAAASVAAFFWPFESLFVWAPLCCCFVGWAGFDCAEAAGAAGLCVYRWAHQVV